MTSATPKPRAGEHTPERQVYFNLREWEEREVQVAKIVVERDLLREREAELVAAPQALTYLGKSASGIIVGPRGWERVQAALAKHGR